MEDKIQHVEWFDDRYYRITKDDKDYFIASVTTKLGIESKPFLAKWRGDIGNREADMRMWEAQERGKRIHYAWYIYLMGGTVIFNPWQKPTYTPEQVAEFKKLNPYFYELSFQDEMVQLWKLQQFFDRVKPKILHAEKIVFSIDDDEAGTLDCAFYINKGQYDVNGSKKLIIPNSGIYILDVKTGSIDETAWCQMASYSHCFRKMGLGEVEGAIILHTKSQNKSGIPGFASPLKTRNELVDYYIDYKNLAAIWKRRNGNKGPKIFQFPSLIRREIK